MESAPCRAHNKKKPPLLGRLCRGGLQNEFRNIQLFWINLGCRSRGCSLSRRSKIYPFQDSHLTSVTLTLT